MTDSYRALLERRAFEMWQMEMATIVVGSCLLVLAVILIWRNRRRIARAADEAAVATLATGVKARRKVGEKAGAYRQRIMERAGEPDPPAR